ncbi:MAG: LTA synthase family protein, partial [Planctomycetota bacterium]
MPTVLLQLVQDPLISLNMVGVNLAKMPTAAILLHGPGIIALPFILFIIAKPPAPDYKRRRFVIRMVISTIIIAAALFGSVIERCGSPQISSAGLRYNCQWKAITNLVLSDYGPLPNPKRRIPFFNQLKVTLKDEQVKRNIVVVVLDGVQYHRTSLGNEGSSLMPHLSALAGQGVQFTNARSSVTHTTKALFAFLTGRYPSVSHDIAETVPTAEPYGSIAMILKSKLNFRTAFFQSAKGSFESRPGLVYNLGFDKFWARDDLNDTKSFLGYLACDEFSMLKPITEWIKAGEQPFFVTILCSVTHDPYEVPEWFATPDKKLAERYQQAICYTDTFLAALNAELAKLNLVDNTILCVIGDHGEAFGEHGMLGHQRIPFEEVLHIPWIMRAPYLIKPGTRITQPVSSVDVTPTLLALLGFETTKADFDGINVLEFVPDNRKVYFSGWMWIDPAGFVKGNNKFIYDPMNKEVSVYDLTADPLEIKRIALPEQQVHKIALE